MRGTHRPRRDLLRDGDFRKLWAAQGISQLGTQVSLLAVPLIGALVVGVDPLGFALLSAVEFLPYLLFSLPAGVWVDRLPRRRVLIAADVGRAAALASIPIAHVVGVLTIWQLYFVGFVTGALSVFFEVAYLSYLPSLVTREQIVEANAKLEASRSAAQVAGPGIGGVVIAALSAPVAIVADAISYLASALCLVRIRPADQRGVEAAGGDRKLRREVAEGVRFVVDDPYLRAIGASTAAANLFTSFILGILVLYLVRELRLPAEAIGAVFAVGNVGLLLGALGAGRIAAIVGVGPAIVGAAALFGPSLILIPLAPRDASLAGAGMIALGIAAASFLNVVFSVNSVSLRQAITPDGLLGRTNATMRLVSWGTIPAGQILGGVVAEVAGLWTAILVGSVGSLLIFLPVLVSPLRSFRAIPGT